MAYNGLKMGTFHMFGNPKCSRFISTFFTHFWSRNNLFSRHFGGFRRAKTGHHSKWAKNTCFGIPCGLGSFFEKGHFFGT